MDLSHIEYVELITEAEILNDLYKNYYKEYQMQRHHLIQEGVNEWLDDKDENDSAFVRGIKWVIKAIPRLIRYIGRAVASIFSSNKQSEKSTLELLAIVNAGQTGQLREDERERLRAIAARIQSDPTKSDELYTNCYELMVTHRFNVTVLSSRVQRILAECSDEINNVKKIFNDYADAVNANNLARVKTTLQKISTIPTGNGNANRLRRCTAMLRTEMSNTVLESLTADEYEKRKDAINQFAKTVDDTIDIFGQSYDIYTHAVPDTRRARKFGDENANTSFDSMGSDIRYSNQRMANWHAPTQGSNAFTRGINNLSANIVALLQTENILLEKTMRTLFDSLNDMQQVVVLILREVNRFDEQTKDIIKVMRQYENLNYEVTGEDDYLNKNPQFTAKFNRRRTNLRGDTELVQADPNSNLADVELDVKVQPGVKRARKSDTVAAQLAEKKLNADPIQQPQQPQRQGLGRFFNRR